MRRTPSCAGGAMKRRWRRWLIGLGLVLAVVLGVRWYLSSSFVARQVASQLEAAYGGRVRVGGASIGAGSTVLTDVELFEKDRGFDQQPWLKIPRLEADVPLTDLLAGALPTKIRLTGVVVTLRFDSEGRILTELPPRPTNAPTSLDSMPEISVTDGQVFLVGPPGREIAFRQVEATLKPTEGRHELRGKGSTAALGEWTATGSLDLAKKNFAVTFGSSGEVAVRQPVLAALPFVPAGVWHDVQAEGRTTVAATLAFDWANSKGTTKVALTPRQAKLHISAIDLTSTNTSGRVEIRDGLITLRGMKGDAYGGR